MMHQLLKRSALFFNKTAKYQFCVVPHNPILLEEVHSRVFQVMRSAAKCKTDKLTESATFEELGFDSLDGVEMVVAMEENFGFDISHEEAERIQTVQDAITIFYKHTVDNLNKEALVKKDEKQ